MLLATCWSSDGRISGVIIADGCDVLSRVLAIGFVSFLEAGWPEHSQGGSVRHMARSADLTHVYVGKGKHAHKELKGSLYIDVTLRKWYCMGMIIFYYIRFMELSEAAVRVVLNQLT